MKHLILFVCIYLVCFRVTADPPAKLVKWILQMELDLVLCKENLDSKNFSVATKYYQEIAALIDSVSLAYRVEDLINFQSRFDNIQKQFIGLAPYFVESFDLSKAQTLVLKTNESETQNILPVIYKQEQQIVALSKDTAKYI